MTEPSLVKATLDDMKKAGLPFKEGNRPYQSKRMTGFNAEVYSAWIGRWAQHSAINYPVISEGWSVRFLRKSAAGIPAVVVGIGPSLDDNIKTLVYARERAIVISTDAALRPLLRHGIKPDLVVNYDARKEQSTMWETINTSDLVLVANSVTSPHTLNAWKGKIIFFNPMQLDDEFATNILPAMYPHLGELPNLGTVGNGAIYLAHEMGCGPILTVGMDLCYKKIFPAGETTEELVDRKVAYRYRCQDYLFKPNNMEFPEGWIETENKVLYDNDLRIKNTFEVDHKGHSFVVDDALKFYANSLLSNIGTLDLPVIDCSGGVLSKYIKHLEFQEALETKCSKQIYPGQTTVRFLNQIVPDCKKGQMFDGEYWRDEGPFKLPTRGDHQ